MLQTVTKDRSMIDLQFARRPAAKLPFSQSCAWATCLSLRLPRNVPGKMALVPGGMEAETKQMMNNIAAALKPHGLGFDSVFKSS